MRLADIIKLELLKYFRFERQYNLICTEGINQADVNAYNGKSLVEVEIKISKNDFKKEFQTKFNFDNRWKFYKHKRYSEPENNIIRGYIVPNKFYLCVPAELVEWAKEYLEDKNEKYGLLSYDLARYTGKTHIINIKPAHSLHNKEQDKIKIALSISRRTVNELITINEKFIKIKKESAVKKDRIP